MNVNLQQTMQKAMGSLFVEISNVKYDLATGSTGIVTQGGLVTLSKDDHLDQNPMDFFSLALPAFAILTPAKDVKRGDIIVSDGKAYAFILEDGIKDSPAPRSRAAKTPVEIEEGADPGTKGELQTINVQGHVSRFRPRRVQMMGVSDGLLIVKSFANMFGQAGGDVQANPMQAMLPLMLMSKGGNMDMKSMLPLMMMGGMAGGGGNMMSNPLMMMALMGGEGGVSNLFK